HWDHAWFTGFAPVDDPQIAVAVLVENGGGGSHTAAPIGRALFDYWMLRRKSDPIVPPSPEELEIIRAQKAEAKALLDAEREAKEAAEKAAKEAAENALKEKPAANVAVE
ncbi:penicillin-binding protein 2, partial [Leptospira borgpetersenii serovar Balcanica]|nr:penicillin-binding protein 2 [Leptospira borgpetersenii serovar Balcanica]